MEGNSGFDDDRWGQNTEQAVNFGIFRMSRTFLISVLDEISLVSPGCNFYITGGDASRFLADSTFGDQLNVKYRPDLVMDGLSVALGVER